MLAVTCLLLAAARDVPLVEATQNPPLEQMTRRELTLEHLRLRQQVRLAKDERPGLVFPAILGFTGATVALFGIGGLIPTLTDPARVQYDSSGYVAGVTLALGVGAVVTSIWLIVMRKAEHDRLTVEIDALHERQDTVRELLEVTGTGCPEAPLPAP